MRNVGSSETSQELAVDVDEPRSKSAVEAYEPKKKGGEVVELKKRSPLEERPVAHPKQHLQSKKHRSKRGRRVSVVIAVAGILAMAFLAWKYVWTLLR